MKNTEDITRKKFNALKKYYDQTWDDKTHTLHVGFFGKGAKTLSKAYSDATLYLINKLNKVLKITKESVILDIGCGTGKTLVYVCKKYGCKGVGVDLSDEMIKDANKHLKEVNKKKKIEVSFIRGSGSELDKVLKKEEKFTHIISQDALFLVNNKKALFSSMYKLLSKGGVFVIDDFLSENPKENYSKKEKELVYNLVNWSKGLSFDMYKEILISQGFKLIHSKTHPKDMIKTYSILANNLKKYFNNRDKTYKDLYDRYMSIVSNVKEGSMNWGIFVGKK